MAFANDNGLVDIFSNSITGNDDGAIHHHRQHFNNSDFNAALPEEVDLQGMEVGVKQISFPLTMDDPDSKQEDPFHYYNRSLYVHVDFIENQCIDGQLKPVLTHLPIQDAIPPGKASTEFHFDDPVYVPTKDIKTHHIHLWITDGHGKPIALREGSVHVLLHFRPRDTI